MDRRGWGLETAGGEALLVPVSLNFGIDDSSLQLGSFGYSTNCDTDTVLMWLLESLQHAWPDVAGGACGLLHSESGGVGAMAHFPTNLALPMATPPEAGAALHWASAG